MEQDRYKQNSKLFIIGLISLLLCLSFLAMSLYILPYLIFNWIYKVPAIIIQFHEWLKEYHNFTETGADWFVFLSFIIPAIIFGLISQWSSNYIEKKMYHLDKVEDEEVAIEKRKDIQESLGFGFKIIVLIVLVILGITLVQWLIAPPSI